MYRLEEDWYIIPAGILSTSNSVYKNIITWLILCAVKHIIKSQNILLPVVTVILGHTVYV